MVTWLNRWFFSAYSSFCLHLDHRKVSIHSIEGNIWYIIMTFIYHFVTKWSLNLLVFIFCLGMCLSTHWTHGRWGRNRAEILLCFPVDFLGQEPRYETCDDIWKGRTCQGLGRLFILHIKLGKEVCGGEVEGTREPLLFQTFEVTQQFCQLCL